jgi:hypothetical protein
MLRYSDVMTDTNGLHLRVNSNTTIARLRGLAEIDVLEVLLGEFCGESTFNIVIFIDFCFVKANHVVLQNIRINQPSTFRST